MLYKVVLELAYSREFPNGNRAYGYELQLPLSVDHRLDYGACRRRRHRRIIYRFWPKEERRGELMCDHRGWFLAFAHGEASDAAILGRTRFIAGEWIPIVEFDGQTRDFRVVEVDKIPRHGDPASPKVNHPFCPVADEPTWRVGAANGAVPREAGAPRRYGEFVGADRPQRASEKTNKSPDTEGRAPKEPPYLTDAQPISDRFDTASADSFPASDAPGWTTVTGVGTPATRGGPSRIGEPACVLKFDVNLEWRADRSGLENTAAGMRGHLLEPWPMGGIEDGMSPEALFVAAAASSFGATLAVMLRASGSPHSSLVIHAEGLVASDLCAAKFTTITVHPTIHGADALRRRAYEQAATSARNHCLIGRSIRGNVAFVVGVVCLIGPSNEFTDAV
jgi:organic hydroperoxide reductase OsmC/OhrA